jgi:sugar lactone lactonase YvrE
MLSTLLLCAVLAGPAQGSVLAELPDTPGYPEGIVLNRGNVYVTTPARFGTAGEGPSEILVLQQSTGKLQATIVVDGEETSAEHALTGITVDQQGELYVLSTQLGVLRFCRSGPGWAQELYASPLWPLASGGFPLPNDAVFDEDGYLYISDSLQGAIWRVAPGGGDPEPWLVHQDLAPDDPTTQFGVNGLRPDPNRDWMYMAVSDSGKIMRVPLEEEPGSPESVFTFASESQPDGLAFSNGGLLYVVLAGANALSVLDVGGSELSRIDTLEGSTIQFSQPANVVFKGNTVLVTNHAILASPEDGLFAVLEVEVGHEGDHVPTPNIP